MDTIKNGPENLIPGAFFLGSIFFGLLNSIGVYDLNYFQDLNDNIAIAISIAIISLSYLLGIFAKRLIPVLLVRPLNILFRFIYRVLVPQLIKEAYQNNKPQKYIIYQEANKVLRNDQYEFIVKLNQYGSDRLNRILDNGTASVILLRSLAIAIISFSYTFNYWLKGALQTDKYSSGIIILTIIVELCIIITHRSLNRTRAQIRLAAYNELMQEKD